MVRKRLIAILLALAVISAVPITASAAEVYTEGNISTTYVTYFEDILGKLSPLDDYVFFRSAQNEYTMLVGKLVYENGTIYSNERCKVYQIYTTSSSYQSNYHFTSNYYAEYSVTVRDSLVYSNLGDFPDLNERGDYLETALLLLVLVIIVMSLVARIFSFCIRTRRS
jgi:hypothetical protein